MGWVDPKTDWNSSQQGVDDVDFNRIEGNIEFLGQGASMQDEDGNSYPTVVVNGLQWTTEHWRSTTFADGSAIPEVTDDTAWSGLSTAAYCKYDNEIGRYGFLYNYPSVDPEEAKTLAPEGWRVATRADVDALAIYLIANGYQPSFSTTPPANGDGDVARPIASQQGWATSATNSTPGEESYRNDETALNMKPAGRRQTSGAFAFIAESAEIWCPNMDDLSSTQVSSFGILYNDVALYISDTASRLYGQSVRMVRDL